jgi:1-acyl-sn-glycerol-3-phosphate acyltransferase
LIYWWASTISINRKDEESKKRAIATAVKVLQKGYRVVIYPEGGRAYNGVMREFKAGVGKLYLESGAPVLPVALKNTREVLPPHGKLKLKKVVEINIGKPMDFAEERAAAAELDKESQKYHELCAQVAQKIENEVHRLLDDM